MPRRILKAFGKEGGCMVDVKAMSLPATAEVVISSKNRNMEWTRRIWHAIALSLVAPLPLIMDPVHLGWCLVFFLCIFSAYECTRGAYQGLKAPYVGSFTCWLLTCRPFCLWHEWAVKKVLRGEEHKFRITSADFMVGAGIIYIFFAFQLLGSPHLACCILILAWADPIAGLVGKRFGKIYWPASRKTVEGSTACACIAALIFFICFPGTPFVAIGIGLLVAIVEQFDQTILQTPEWMPRSILGTDIATPADNATILVSSGTAMAIIEVIEPVSFII